MSKHIHRVGSLTFGLTLIVTGALYIASLYFDVIRPETVMQLWPAVLIALGLEILASLARDGVPFVAFRMCYSGFIGDGVVFKADSSLAAIVCRVDERFHNLGDFVIDHELLAVAD